MDRRGQLIVTGLPAIALLVLVAVAVWPRGEEPPSANAPVNADGVQPAPPITPADPVPWAHVSWRRLANPLAVGPGPGQARIDGLVRSASGLVGWGITPAPGRNQLNEMGAAFLSAAGDHWTNVTIEARVGRNDTSEIYQIASGGTWLLAVGAVCCDDEEGAAVWRSGDGMIWERLALDPVLGAMEISDVLGTAAGFVAVGAVAGNAAIATSTDGASWSAIDPAEAGLGAGGVSDAAATRDGYVAVGWRDDGASYDGALWHSADGVRWEALAIDPIFVGPQDTRLDRVWPFVHGTLVEGNEGAHAERVRCEQLEGLVAAADGVGPPRRDRPDFTCGWGLRTEWRSIGARRWERLPVPWGNGVEPPPGTISGYSAVVGGGPGLVAVAEAAGDPELGTWITADGGGWARLPSAGGFEAGDSVTGLAVDGRRIVALGERWDPDAALPGVPAMWLGVAD